jgi:drug/metabolite transporter (DMT)-like permease
MKFNKSEQNLAWIAFAVVSVVWGTTFYAIRVGLESMPPFLMAAVRQSTAGVVLVSYFLLKGHRLPPLNEYKRFAIIGTFMFLLGNGLVSWGMMYVPTGLAAIVCALTPVWMVIINSFGKQREFVNYKVIIGFILCLVAQVLIFKDKGLELSNPLYAIGLVFIFIANIAWAFGSIYAKRTHSTAHPMLASGFQMLFGGILLSLVGFATSEAGRFHINQNGALSLVYLILLGSLLSYGSFMYMLKRLPAAVVSTYAYINTVVAVVLGWLFLSETLNFNMLLGVLFTLAGVWIISKNVKFD